MYDAATGEHIYLSTACLHDRHDQCRAQCEHCPQTCLCRCHYRRDSTMTEFVDNPAAPDADQEPLPVEPEQGEPVVEPDEDPAPYGDDDAVADEEDHLAEQTDNSGENGEEAPQEPDAVEDDDSDDDGEPEVGDDDGE